MRIDDRREAVRDENHRAIAGGDQAIQRALHGRLGLGVQRLSVDHERLRTITNVKVEREIQYM